MNIGWTDQESQYMNVLNKMREDLEHSKRKVESLQQMVESGEKEKEGWLASRQKLMKRIHELEVDIMNKHQQILEANKNAALAISKMQVKLDGSVGEILLFKQKLEERDRTVLSLKNEIALYNEECLSLKTTNEELDFELQRMGREIRDVMVNYENQLQAITKNSQAAAETLQNSANLVAEKEKMLLQTRAELRES